MYYKIVSDQYIISVGTGSDMGEQIDEFEYLNILAAINSKPETDVGIDYRLKANLEWESFEVPIVESHISPEEALNIITGSENI